MQEATLLPRNGGIACAAFASGRSGTVHLRDSSGNAPDPANE
jgi:hypothetical protein